MTALAALPSNMRFDNCDGCRVRFSKRNTPMVATLGNDRESLTIGVCAACALALAGEDRSAAEQLSARVEATARLRPNRTEAPR